MLTFYSATVSLAQAASPFDALLNVLSYVLFPAAALVIGSAIALIRVPGPTLRSMIQHFAAGVVFAAVAAELLPDVMHLGEPLPAIIGFALGIAVMLGVRALARRLEAVVAPAGEAERPALTVPPLITSQPVTALPVSGEAERPALTVPPSITRQPVTALPISLVLVVAIDVGVVDGLLVGIAVAAGAKAGLLITLALTIEVLFIGLSTVVALGNAGVRPAIALAVSGGLALVLAVSAVITALLLGGLAGGQLEGALAFGMAALLYLVTEELLVDAHEVPETMFTTAAFFAGFLILLLISMIMGA